MRSTRVRRERRAPSGSPAQPTTWPGREPRQLRLRLGSPAHIHHGSAGLYGESRILLSPPDIRDHERRSLLAALDSGWVAPAGPDLDAFEREVAELTGRAHGVGLSSGTAALHLALLELGVTRGDDVLVPTFTFAATANAVCYLGATPVFIDSDATSWNLSPQLLADELEHRGHTGSRMPAAVIAVDLYGRCADFDQIGAICTSWGIPLVEDAAEAIGASRAGRPAGSFGQASVLSFNGNKLITTSGGGMLVCDDPELARRVRYLSTQARQPTAHYEHTEIGYNYRLSNLLAALGRGQLATLADRIQRRRSTRDLYIGALGDQPGVTFAPVDLESNAWLTCVTVDADTAGIDREAIRLELEELGIETRPLWKPLHLQPVFAGNPARVDGTAEHLYRTGLCLPSGSGITDDERSRVVEALRSVLHP